METSAGPAPARTKDLKSQIANFEELVGNILSTGERAGGANAAAMLDQMIALHAAIEDSNLEVIAQLANEGVDLNERFVENVDVQHVGITPLALACATNKVNVVQALIEHGADVNRPFAALNTTALMTSSYHGHADVVRVLLQNGADVQMVDLQQSTALGYSFGGSRNLNVVQMLLDHHIDVNKKNMLGMNALLLVAGYGNEALVEKILRAGAEPNTVNDFGHTALHLTVVGKRDLLKKLRRLGTAEAVAADRSLNRRNLDVAIQEWARLHRDEVGGTTEDEHALAKAGSIMMSVGHQLEDHPGEDEDEQAVLQKRVQAVWKHRQEKIQRNREKSKSGIWSLLSCGGGKSSKLDDPNATGAKPYSPAPQLQAEPPKAPQDEYGRLSQSFARILRLLIDARCEIDRAEKTFGMTALDLAILNGDVESSAVLTSAGADPNHFLKMLALKDLYQAIVTGQRKEVKDLLTYDEDLDVNQIFSRFNVDTQSSDEGMTPITLATRMDDIEMVKMLLKKGANVNLMGPSGCFPLAEASAKGNIKMATLLLANNASLEKTCPAMQDATPLTIASNTQKHKLVEFYIKRGAKVDQPMSDGRIPILRAFEGQDMDMVDILLKQSTQTNFSDMQGLTAHLAAEYQSKDRDTEAILSKVSDAVRVFQEEEEAMAAANVSVNTTEENNDVSMQGHHVTPPREVMPPHATPQQQQQYQPHPEEVQEQMERAQVPQQHQIPEQQPIQQQQYIPQQEQPIPQHVAQQVQQPARPAPTARPRPAQKTSPTRPSQPGPPAPQPEPEITTSEVVTRTIVTRTVVIGGEEIVVNEEESTSHGPPPPVPTTAPPVEQFSAEVSQPTIPIPEPKESSSPRNTSKDEVMDENSSTESEYTTDDDEEEEDEDEEEDEEEEEEASPAPAEEHRPGIVITSVVRHAPVAMAEMVEFEGETDIDAIRDADASPTPHETSDVNENVVKEETTETTTNVSASPNANPPPVPVTSPPRESNETTV